MCVMYTFQSFSYYKLVTICFTHRYAGTGMAPYTLIASSTEQEMFIVYGRWSI